MNNTALRAGVQSTNNKHMVFSNEEHEKFYYEKLEQAQKDEIDIPQEVVDTRDFYAKY